MYLYPEFTMKACGKISHGVELNHEPISNPGIGLVQVMGISGHKVS